MAAANQSLNTNRELVGKRKQNRFSFVHTSTQKTEYNLPNSTPEIIKRIQENSIRENKRMKIKRFVVLGVILVILLSLFIYFI